MSHKKVALFVPNLQGGGAERVMITLSGGFMQAGYAVDLVVGNADGPYRAEVPYGVRVVDLAAGRVLTAFPKLCRYLRRERPDVLLATLTHANVMALLAKVVSGTKVKVYVRETNIWSRPDRAQEGVIAWLTQMSAKLVFVLADGIIVPSRGVEDDLVENHGLRHKNLRVINNPVVEERLYSLAAEAPLLPWAREKSLPLIVGVGRLSAAKDFASLIRAFRLVKARIPARLLILGEGGLRGELEQLVAELDLTSDVALPGFVVNPFAVMARAAVFVLSSRFEGLPNALIQALALGVPIVATDCPSGPREILQNGALGKLVPVGDVERMADAIVAQLKTAVAARGPHPAADRFGVQMITKEYAELFEADAAR